MKSISRSTLGLTTSVSVLGVVFLAIFVYCCIYMWQGQRQEEMAQRAFQSIEHLLQKPTSEYSAADIHHDLDEVLGSQGYTEAKIFDAAGTQVFGPERFFENNTPIRNFSKTFAEGQPQFQATYVELAINTIEDQRFLNFISGIFASSILLWILLSVLISKTLLSLVLRPINRLTNRIHHLGPQSIDQLIVDERAPVELQPFIEGFNQLLNQLRENREQLKSFNSNVAHELNTPLSSLKISHELLYRRESIEGHELKKIVDDHLDEIERMTRIIRSMLFLANATQGRELKLDYLPSLNKVVSSVAEYLEQLAEERNLTIEVTGESSISVETELIKRAVNNLLSNAIRYAKPGTTIMVEITCRDGYTWINVNNLGPTIQPEKIKHLFEPFYRAEAGRSDTGENHGLGLAIVAAIAKLHAGEVYAASSSQFTTIGFSVRT